MDVWARKQDMNTKRAIHTLAVMNDRLYAIGGNHLKGHIFSSEKVSQCPTSLIKNIFVRQSLLNTLKTKQHNLTGHLSQQL